jgi:hypothetical protein
MPNVFDTVGVEIETDTITQRVGEEITAHFRGEFKADRDASIESNSYRTPSGVNILNKKFIKGVSREVLGVEFISSPMVMDAFRPAVRKLTGILRTMGEPEKSKRSSIHIHVGCDSNIKTLQNVLKLFKYVEPLFYRLGGMGYDFRGKSNKSIYCRPITTVYGPPIVPSENGHYYSIFNPEDLLEEGIDSSRFWYIMCIDPNRIQRYHPSRYFGLNIFSTLLHGTLEFRFFNKTLDHMKISAVASLCQGITEWATKNRDGSYKVPSSGNTDEDRLNFLIELINKNTNYKMSDIDAMTLNSIMTLTSPYSVEEEFVKSHLFGKWTMNSFWMEGNDKVRHPKESVVDSGFIDIHNINNKPFDILDVII